MLKAIVNLIQDGNSNLAACSSVNDLKILHSDLLKEEFFLFPAFSKKSGGTLFSAFRGARCVERGEWFRICIRYLVCATPPTV